MNDKELEMQDFDEWIASMADAKPVIKHFVPVNRRIGELRVAMTMLKRALEENGIEFKMHFEQGEIDPTCGDIDIECREFVMNDMQRFSRVLELSDYFYAVPLTAKGVRISFTFDNLLEED